MIRELSTIEEIAGNFYIELDDNVSSNTGKATLEVLQQFIFNGWIDQPVRKSDNVQFNSVTSSKGNWSVDELGNIVGKLVTLVEGWQTDNFVAGMTGTGVGIVNKAEVHADKVLVRKYLEVLALVVAQMFYRGGRQVLSPAGMKVNRVVEGDTYYRLYMETDEGQVNEFSVGAQARVNRYGSSQRYWWRLVTGIGTDYIDVSKTDMDSGSAVPSVGDEVVQFGHRTDPYLQWVVMDSSFSDDAGTTIYAGVDSYDLSGKMVLRLGVDPQDPGRIGLFLRNGSEISEEITRIDTEIGNVSEVTDGLNEELTETRNTLNNLIQQTIPDLQNQIDGAIQSWDGTEEPTLENYPASEWTTDTEKNRHVGDTYYQNTGDGLLTWKFVRNDDGSYSWQKVADSDTAALEQDIRELAGIVGTKNSIHYTDNVPTPPYVINDIWIKTDGTMYTCISQRDEGQVGGVSDWELFNDTMVRLAAMASDSVISKEEKAVLRDTWAQVEKEYATYQSQASTYGVDITGLTNAYNSLSSYLTGTVKINENTDTSLSVSQKSDYNTRWANWNSETTEFANAVAQKVADEAVDNLEIGFINLVSFKRMLSWNEKNKDIAVWGQDSDGVYLGINPSLLYSNITGDTEKNDCFLGEGNYKSNTQYVFSVDYKNATVGENVGLIFYAVYTDGTNEQVFSSGNDTSRHRKDFVTTKGKTVKKIYGTYGVSPICRVYSLSLIEGNVVPLEIPTSSEDEWRSEVNLVDGGKEVTVTAGVYTRLVVPLMKPNTVYTVSFEGAEVTEGDEPTGYEFRLYDGTQISTARASVKIPKGSKSGLLITSNDFTAGEGRLLFYPGIQANGIDRTIKYTGISLVEGFHPPQGWTPSAGDTRAEIEATGTETKDSFAQKLGYDSYEDMKYNLGQGMITETGYLNAALIETDKLVVTDAFVNNITINDAFISKLNGWTFDFHSGKVGGFTIADNKLYAGADFGSGAGVYMQSLANNYGFRAYKDASNYVEMFYRTASDWGLKGLAGGSTVFQLGSTNKIGPFVFGENNLTAESVYDSRALVLELTNNIISFKHAMGTIYQKEVYFGAVPDDITYGAHTLLAVVGGDIYHQGTVGEDGRRSCRFYTSDMYLRNPRDHRQLIGGDWHYVCYPTQSGRFSFTPNSDGSGEVQINIVETTTEYAVIGSFESQNETVDSRDRFNFCIRRKTSTYFILSYKEIQYTRVYFSYIIAPIYPS